MLGRFVAAGTLACLLSMSAGAADVARRTDIQLNRYTTTDRSYATTAYWLESPKGLVLIDALFLNTDAAHLATLLKSRDKPLLGIFLTHPHVDHFGGLTRLRRQFPGTPIYASAATAAAVTQVHQRAYADGWIQAFGDAYDAEVTVPDQLLDSGQMLQLGDMQFTLRSLGPGEAPDNSLIISNDLHLVFAGDALVRGAMYYVGEGRSAKAMAMLQALTSDALAGWTALPGHGEAGPLGDLAARNLAQVTALRDIVTAVRKVDTNLDARGFLNRTGQREAVDACVNLVDDAHDYGLGRNVICSMNVRGIDMELQRGAEQSHVHKTAHPDRRRNGRSQTPVSP